MVNKFLNVLLISFYMILAGCSTDESSNSQSDALSSVLKSKAVLTVEETESNSGSFQVKSGLKNAGKTQKSASYTIQDSEVR